jgi:hypothetical protein
LKAPAIPLSDNTGEPIKINGPVKFPIEPEAIINSPLLAVVVLREVIRPLLCLMICAIYFVFVLFINTLILSILVLILCFFNIFF